VLARTLFGLGFWLGLSLNKVGGAGCCGADNTSEGVFWRTGVLEDRPACKGDGSTTVLVGWLELPP
jgi:hypothetical protein